MKAVILAGGFGSRLSEETQVKPKPMVEVGGKPILWHILKVYAAHGIGDVNIRSLLDFHRDQGALATLTAVPPPGRFGALTLGSTQTHVHDFHEKPCGEGAWVNCGFFVVEPAALDYIADDATVWEKDPLQALARAGALAVSRKAPWKICEGDSAE